MKKIMLLPLLVMSMLVGCNQNEGKEAETIYTISDWFENADVFENELSFYVDGYKTTDYDKNVAQKMFDYFHIEHDHPKKIDEVDNNDLISYTIKKNMGPYTDFTIYIHETSIETAAKGTLNDRMILQCGSYKTYSALATSLFITYASKRNDEIHRIKNEEYEAAKEAGSLENFYKEIEESTTNPIATYSNVTKEDTDHALLDDIKDLFGKYNEKAYGANKGDAFMSYGLNENFMLKFYLDKTEDCIAMLEYEYRSSLGYNRLYDYGYKVNRDKVDNLIKKITGAAS